MKFFLGGDLAAELAGLDDYRLVEYPRQKDPFQAIMDDIMKVKVGPSIKEELGPYYKYDQQLKEFPEYGCCSDADAF